MEDLLRHFFYRFSGDSWDSIEALPLSGSARLYYRIYQQGKSYIAVYHEDLRENRLFIRFSRHFKSLGLPVPVIYALSEDERFYLQEDLGRFMLLDVAAAEQDADGRLSDRGMALYKKTLSGLLRMQLVGHQKMDYSVCLPRPAFDRTCVMWDLNYFKYCFLKLAGIPFDEQQLERDFHTLAELTAHSSAEAVFMFRDFQSRNIMVKDEELFFIDYQGGREGMVYYDLASLLYDAVVGIPEDQREELLDGYIAELNDYGPQGRRFEKKVYDGFVLLRLLQALGAFGLRGLHERKPHFIASIAPALNTLSFFLEQGRPDADLPELAHAIRLAGQKFCLC